ncbi:uncharacterized protein LOC142495268 isoform X2 [Ascaphus truei]|uniref:uncharacterized protein LOC142495268 isoform X2 n=1 Tax=Ascaphus truei TaxID=8439 RepID=UPI003F5A60A3
MSSQTRINGFTAWINVRLFDFNNQVNNVLHELFQGTNLNLLLESFTGRSLKRFHSLEGLTQQQIITRVEWFVEEMKKHDIIMQNDVIHYRSIALQKKDHVLDLLWKLITHDILFTWERSCQLQHGDDKVVCSVPFQWIPETRPPEKVQPVAGSVLSLLSSLDALSSKSHSPSYQKTKSSDVEAFYPFPDRELAKSFNKNLPKGGWDYYPSPEKCILDLVNGLLKVACKDKKVEIRKIEDLVHCHVICNLVNYFLPHTFTVEVILNDRWAVNVALKTLEALLFITTSFSCDDLLQGDLQAVCAYVCFICMAGYKYKQSRSVVNYMKKLSVQIDVATSRLKILSSEKLELNQFAEKNDLQHKVIKMKNEMQRLRKSYDMICCQKWVKHARKVQSKTKDIIQQKIKDCFDIVVVPRSLTIASMCSSLGINLQLTEGLGFYQLSHKKTLTSDCRLVLQKRDTQEFLEDFSGQHPKINIRKLLNLPPFEVTEVDPNVSLDYKVFFECKSKNKILKANSLFLYQVFPGNTSQWLQRLHQAVKANDYCTIENMLHFFKETCPGIINLVEPSSGTGVLNLACQAGFFDIVLLLLENGASVDVRNVNGRTALYSAMAGQHQDVCQLLIEWEWKLCAKDIRCQTVVDAIFNQELKDYCKAYCEMWQTTVPLALHGNIEVLKKLVEDHKNGRKVMASLRSRCVDGSTLLHVAAYFGEYSVIETLLQLQLDVDILDYRGATPLQRSRDVKTMQFSQGASKRKWNKKGLLPVHCAAMQGQVNVIQAMIESDAMEWSTINETMMERNIPSLPYLAMANNHLKCVKWLISKEFSFRPGEEAELLFDIICDEMKTEDKVHSVDFLISNGVNVNTRNKIGNSALHFAALRTDCYEILRLLLICGAEVDVENDTCVTPLFYTIFMSNFHGTRLLIDYGANVNHLDDHGLTAFAHIHNFDEWIGCGLFDDEINDLFKAYDLQQSVQLVRHVSKQLKKIEVTQQFFGTKTAQSSLPFRSLQH